MDPFEQSADMRLLELQRKALGKEAPPRPNWSGTATDMHEAIPLQEDAPPQLSGARVLVDLSASPKAKLVAGAVVTLSLAIQNAGDKAAYNLKIAVPIPGESRHRDGSLVIDGRVASGSYADAFFGEGYQVETLAAGQRLGFVWKISIEAGTKALVVAPRVLSENAAVVGSASVLLARGAITKTAALPAEYRAEEEPEERPFYELDAQEEREHALEAAQVQTPAAQPLWVMPDIAEPEPQALAASASREPEPEPQPQPPPQPVQAPPEPEGVTPPAVPDLPRLYCTFDAASLNLVKKLFAAESYGQIPHYILQNSLASSLSASGTDIGLRSHFSQQAGMLSRALLMHKLNKPMSVADFSVGKTGFELPPAAEVPPNHHPSIMYTSLTPADIDFCAPVEGRNQLETFIRIRQLAIALQAHHVISSDGALQTNAQRLLDAYATAARGAINKTFIRAKLDRNFDPFGGSDPAIDGLARELIDVLGTLLAA